MNIQLFFIIILTFTLLLIYFIHIKLYDLVFTYDTAIPLTSLNLEQLYNYNQQINKINLYYINMDKSVERKQRFLSRMTQFNNYNIIRIQAVTPKDLPNYNIQSNLLCSSLMKPEEFGCTLSHLKAIETAYNNNDQYALITEDDLIINKNINWEYLISQSPTDWDIIQLFVFPTFQIMNNAKNEILKDNWLVKTNIYCPSTVCYLISRQGMNKLLTKFVDNKTNSKTIMLNKHDRYCLADNLIYHNLNRYYCPISFVGAEEFDSTISTFILWIRSLIK